MINKSTILDFMYEAMQKKNKGITFIKTRNTEKKVSYKELFNKAKLVLKHLQVRGLKKGDEVIIRLSDNEMFLYTYLACLLGGLIPIPLDYYVKNENINKMVKIYDQITKFVMVTEEDLFTELYNCIDDDKEEAVFKYIKDKVIYFQDINTNEGYGTLEEVTEKDIAFIQYSSGSTGNPKGVVITHENLMTNIESIIKTSKQTSEDIYISWMPLHHDLGLVWFCLIPIVLNIDQYNIDTSVFLKYPLIWLEKASEKKATILGSPNFGYKYLLEAYEDSKDYCWDLSNVRLIINGAEPISVDLVKKFMNTMKKYNLDENAMYPVYGLAEATLIVSLPIPGQPFKSIKINRNYLRIGDEIVMAENGENSIELALDGIKLSDMELRITDLNHEQLPSQNIGQIEIRGKNVTKGYYKEKLSDREKYMSEDGWLNTGDLGFLINNHLVIAARQKDIVVIKGQNFYLYDIDQALEKLDNISVDGVISCVVSGEDNEDLLIVFVKHELIDDKFINMYKSVVRTLNKEFGIQAYSVLPIKNIPKTASGKLQRHKAAEIYKGLSKIEKNEMEDKIKTMFRKMNTAFKESAYDILDKSDYKLNSVEKKVTEIISNILKLDEIGIFNNLFDLGIDSISVRQICQDLKEEYGEIIQPSFIYKYPIIKELCDFIIKQKDTLKIKSNKKSKKDNYNSYTKKYNDYYELTDEQKRLYVLYCLDNKSTNYNISAAWILKGNLDIKRLNYAFIKLIERHESLRTSFHLIDGQLMQRIHKNFNFNIEESKLAENQDLDEIISKSVKPFNLTISPLIRVKIINLEKDKNVMFLDMHHIIGDGASQGILINELESLYCGRNLSKLDSQYKDYVKYQSEFKGSDMYPKAKEYWNYMYENKPFERELITDHKRRDKLDYEGKRIYKTINKELSKKIKDIGISNNSTLFMVLLSAFSIALSNYYYEDDISIGIPVMGRPNKDFNEVVGLFVNTLAIRLNINKNFTFEEYLSYVKNICIDGFSNDEYQFDELVNDLNIPRKANKNPIFDVFLALQNVGTNDLKLEEINIKKYNYKNNSARFDISMDVYDKENLSCVLEYRVNLFEEETIEKIFNNFEDILVEVTNTSKVKINDIISMQKNQTNNMNNCMDFSFNF